MNFKEWSKASVAAGRVVQNLTMNRQWLLRARSEPDRVFDRDLRVAQLNVNVQVYARYEGEPADIHIRIDAENYGTIQNPIGELSGELLRVVARMRDTVQLWIDGKIDELPPSNVP